MDSALNVNANGPKSKPPDGVWGQTHIEIKFQELHTSLFLRKVTLLYSGLGSQSREDFETISALIVAGWPIFCLSQVDITTVNRSVRYCDFSSFIFVNKYSLRFGLLAHFTMTSFACLLLLLICSPGVDRWSIGVATSLTRGVKSIMSWVSLNRLP